MLFDLFQAQSLQLKNPDVRSQYFALADELSNIGLLYMHVLDHSAMGAPPVPEDFKLGLRERFKGAFILAGGYAPLNAPDAATFYVPGPKGYTDYPTMT